MSLGEPIPGVYSARHFAGALLLVLVIASGAAPADTVPPTPSVGPVQAVSLNPLSLIVGRVSGGYEWQLGAMSSLVISAEGSHVSVDGFAFTTAGLGAAWREYPFGKALEGWYGSPLCSLDYDGASQSDASSGTGRTWGIVPSLGLVVGYQWVWEGGFLLDLAAGGAYGFGTGEATLDGETVSLPDAGFSPVFRLALGWAWR